MPRASRLPSLPDQEKPELPDQGDKFFVGDTVEIKNEGIHGFKEGTQLIVTEIGVHDNLGNEGYKVDLEEDGRHRSRYIDEKDLRKPKKVVHPLPVKLSKEAREQRTLVKALAYDRWWAERPVDRIAKAKGSRAIARSRNPTAEASAGTGSPQATPKPSSPKLRPLKVHTVKETTVKPTKGSLVKLNEQAKIKQGTKRKPKSESGSKVVSKKAQLR